VRGSFVHADLYEVDLRQTIEVSVPSHVTGKATGVEFGGGVLDQALREVEVKCLPRAIPDEFVVDVSPLQLGDSLHVRDLVLPEGVELVSDGNLSIVSVVAPTKEEEPGAVEAVEGEAAAPAEAAEPAEGGAESAERGD